MVYVDNEVGPLHRCRSADLGLDDVAIRPVPAVSVSPKSKGAPFPARKHLNWGLEAAESICGGPVLIESFVQVYGESFNTVLRSGFHWTARIWNVFLSDHTGSVN